MKIKTLPFVASIIPGTIFMSVILWKSSTNPWGLRRFTLFDDAMISMDYARTLARTGNFDWFPGAPRIQGFTNPLWTLWMSVIHLAGLNGSNAALAVSVSGIVLLIGCAWICYDLITKAIGPERLGIALVSSGSVLFMYPTIFWTLRGMEVGLLAFFTLLLIRGVIAQSNQNSRTITKGVMIPAALGIATRFDFIVMCLVALVALTFWSPQQNRVKVFVVNGCSFAAFLFAVCATQKLYWGSWLPNTYHLKMDGVHLVDRVSRGLFAGAKSLPILFLLAFALYESRFLASKTRQLVHLTIGIFAAISAYSTYIGGDAWEDLMLNRFYATALPLLAIVVATSLSARFSKWKMILVLFSLLVTSIGYGLTVNPFGFSQRDFLLGFWATFVGCLLILTTTFPKFRTFKFMQTGAIVLTFAASLSGVPLLEQVRNHNVLGARLNLQVTEVVLNVAATTQPDAVIATVWAGVPTYYSHRKMIDLLGKVDVHIAQSKPHGEFFPGHNKWDYEYSIGKLQPDVIFQTFERGLEKDLPQRIRSWGYAKFCTHTKPFPSGGVYYKLGSTQIIWGQLHPCKSS